MVEFPPTAKNLFVVAVAFAPIVLSEIVVVVVDAFPVAVPVL